ncbi:DUF6345 domain-containing protein [Marinibactrum halimedae]|uniref:Phospholipase n=1 Tax=Marinibactrum halimedae TaxID=1444977 RepID=A0AA37T0S9_9GAMM|nr:DUF6345 domain-containing protein [Marinibactrum halimedae]MCD9459147.1 DUF6345 domain-containing protein [Marinibactrum halimedae]GLS24749.1 hypothetical protein GCM10007877_04630 [Marinibactrum halimedae]
MTLRVITGIASAFCLLTAASQTLALEAKVFAISDFVPTSSGGCGSNDVAHWDNMVDRWYDRMGNFGHQKDGQYTNGSMTLKRFCDPDWNSNCEDHLWVDEADAAMIATHGSDSGDHWAGTMRTRWLGHCALDGGGNASEMHVGDFDLEFIHLSSCYSADDDNLDGIREAMHDPEDSPSNGRRAHQWDGFHGIMWIGSRFNNDYRDFVSDAHSTSMASAWVSNMYNSRVGCAGYDPFNWFGTCQEQCPVAYSIGNGRTDALNRINNERYNYVFSDPSSNNTYAYRYIPGCNPVGENAFSAD